MLTLNQLTRPTMSLLYSSVPAVVERAVRVADKTHLRTIQDQTFGGIVSALYRDDGSWMVTMGTYSWNAVAWNSGLSRPYDAMTYVVSKGGAVTQLLN